MKTVLLLFAVVLFGGATACSGNLTATGNSLSAQTLSVGVLNISSKIVAAQVCDQADQAQETEAVDQPAPEPDLKTQHPPLVTTHN